MGGGGDVSLRQGELRMQILGVLFLQGASTTSMIHEALAPNGVTSHSVSIVCRRMADEKLLGKANREWFLKPKGLDYRARLVAALGA